MKFPLISLLLSIFIPIFTFAQDSENVSLYGQYHRGEARYSGSWAYIDLETRKEYALLGGKTGTSVYCIDNLPINELGFIEGPSSNWREITVLGKYAYVTTEGSGTGEGMQIIDLTDLPDSISLANTYTETFTRGHIIQRDIYSEAPYLYIMGTCNNCGVNILDVTDPINPKEVSTYSPGYYIHDAHVKGNYLYASAFFNGTIDIVDISDKLNPTLVAQIETTGGNTHSAWTTEDNKHLIISLEKDGLPARIWNIEDLSNLYEVATYTGNSASLTHNPYVRGNYTFFAHNTEGLRVVDTKDPSVPVEVGYYDTFDGLSGGFSGLWSACPYFPSGKIIGGNREDGLYVWTFNDVQAGRFYASVVDESTQEKIPNATVFIQKIDLPIIPDLSGLYKFGALSGVFRLEVSAEGYDSLLQDITLEPGDSLVLNFQLAPKSVGIFDLALNLPTFKISPNPFTEFTVVDLSAFEKAAYLRVFNAFGQLVRTENVVGGNYHILDKENLEAGVHVFMVYGRDNELLGNQKVVIGE